MNIVNETITHGAFGEGTVVSQTENRVSVQFFAQYGIKQFVYPDAFEKCLKLQNNNLELSVLEELHDKQAQIEAERLRRQQERAEAKRVIELEKAKLEAEKKKMARKSKPSKPKIKRGTNPENDE